MKKIIQLLLIIITTSMFSQHVDLQGTEWFAQSVTTSGITTNIPNDPIEFPYVSINFFDGSTGLVGTSNGTPNTMDANYQCELGFVAHLNYIGTDAFTFQDITLTNTTTDCSSIIINFVSDYVAFFNDVHSENFTYTITDETNSSKTLSIVNFNGDTVTYTNQWFTTASEDIANHTWLLNYIEIEGIQQNTPNNEEVSEVRIAFNSQDNGFGTGVCGGFGGSYDFYEGENVFYVFKVNSILINCGLSTNFNFENDYLGFYIDNLPGPFNYQVTQNGTTLTITNTEGNTAVYTREVLSTQEFIQNIVSIYPNPVKDTFTIENNNMSIQNIKVFNVLGKKVIETQNKEVTISNLENGIYLVNVMLKNGEIINQKIIKK